MKRKFGMLCMIIGAMLIAAALSLFVRNRREDRQAGNASEELLLSLKEEIAAAREEEAEQPSETGMRHEDADGYGCIGFLSIPKLELELPVQSDWDYEKLKTAPCRYYGSVKTGDLVLVAHNYERHFGRLSDLTVGDCVYFTDMDGAVFAYEVVVTEVLQPDAVDDMTDGDYALTLFTCTYGGKSRVTVRCEICAAANLEFPGSGLRTAATLRGWNCAGIDAPAAGSGRGLCQIRIAKRVPILNSYKDHAEEEWSFFYGRLKKYR